MPIKTSLFILNYLFLIISKINSLEEQQYSNCNNKNEKLATRCLEPMLAFANVVQERQNLEQNEEGKHQRHFSLPEGPQECTSTLECESLSVRAVEASYGYMCGIGNQQFKEHADCFSRVENRADYIHCRSVAGQEMDKATNKKYENNGEKFNDKTQQSQLCFTMNNYLDCCRPLVERSCGSKAWELVAKITRDSLRVSLPDCVLTSLEKNGEI